MLLVSSGCVSGLHEGFVWEGNGRKTVVVLSQGGPKARDMCGVAVAAALQVICLNVSSRESSSALGPIQSAGDCACYIELWCFMMRVLTPRAQPEMAYMQSLKDRVYPSTT